ncbi:DDB1- and CUL4-associated factor 10 homolog [Anopheles marshallii]|uniref:DDB1- and CUL4-associated factor 10 homolog n=1 Tax=Anopheles marshallii TaxID=1521116 RepID=UPI00237A5CB5|nr:DDB1- and CUL4-associated factor 10 homolog [Anopheles marshallii]
MSLHEWYRRRERGLPPRIGDTDMIHRTIFRSLQPKLLPDDLTRPYRCGQDCGAICNLEFSPDGTVLAAACEYKSIVLFDPLTEKQVCAVDNAHDGSVNCIRFVDNRTFASCSDDTTVALWDSRNLSTKLRTLNGHSGWVKNIEYAKQAGILISSGLDGLVYGWELNNSTEQGCTYQRLLYMPGLMRCRLAPDGTRLVLCTSSGYLMLVHDLHFPSLAGDLVDFRPNIHRLNLMRKQRIPCASRKTPAVPHSRKRNRIEFVSDFPPGDDAEMISGLTIHPQGWCALSRNLSYDEKTEWSVVHDIQSWSEEEDDTRTDQENLHPDEEEQTETEQDQDQQQEGDNHNGFVEDKKQQSNGIVLSETTWCNSSTMQRNVITNVFPSHSGASCLNLAHTPHLRLPPNGTNVDGGNVTTISNEKAVWPPETTVARKRTAKHVPADGTRLLYYIQESNKVEGYMREACFSPDGRVICSPHDDYGVRLLAFNEQCNEMQYARQYVSNGSEPEILRELQYKPCHPHIVISSQFSPRFPLLVTGCLLGNVVWNLPVLS